MIVRSTLRGAAALALAAALGSAQAQAPIKIGFMAELSGPQGALGQDQYDAFMMVVERNGGKLGGVPVQIVRRDTQLKPEVANQIADELVEKEKVAIVTGFSFSNILMAVNRKLTSAGVVVVGHADYYPRFGFLAASSFGLTCPFKVPDESFLALELEPGALAGKHGRVAYAPEFKA